MTPITHWFGFGSQKKAAKRSLKQQREEASLTYSPQLVPSLLDDHAELFKLYGDMEMALKDGHYDMIPNILSKFKTKLDVHLLSENLRFYSYLEQSLAASPENLELMRGFRTEMNSIARAGINFIRKWKTSGVTVESAHSFAQEAQQVKALLAERIQREETSLYPLYAPPEK